MGFLPGTALKSGTPQYNSAIAIQAIPRHYLLNGQLKRDGYVLRSGSGVDVHGVRACGDDMLLYYAVTTGQRHGRYQEEGEAEQSRMASSPAQAKQQGQAEQRGETGLGNLMVCGGGLPRAVECNEQRSGYR